MKLKRWLMRHLFGVHVPYTDKEMRDAGYARVDNSDLNNLLRLATKKAEEKNASKMLTQTSDRPLEKNYTPSNLPVARIQD